MLDPPSLPTKPYKPKRLQFCGIGLIVGLIFGGAAAYSREKLNGKVYTEKEIKKLLPFEIMSEIPLIETPEEQVAHRRNNWMAVGAAVVVVGAILLGSAITYLYS